MQNFAASLEIPGGAVTRDRDVVAPAADERSRALHLGRLAAVARTLKGRSRPRVRPLHWPPGRHAAMEATRLQEMRRAACHLRDRAARWGTMRPVARCWRHEPRHGRNVACMHYPCEIAFNRAATEAKYTALSQMVLRLCMGTKREIFGIMHVGSDAGAAAVTPTTTRLTVERPVDVDSLVVRVGLTVGEFCTFYKLTQKARKSRE